jgi:urocanate hydratase
VPGTLRVKKPLIDIRRSPAASDSLQLEAYGFYHALTAGDAFASQEIEPSLGGNLLYAGELDFHGCAMVVAGNVAGCATLAATADQTAQKHAIRDGAVDFVVTSLDEALRILKNELRKRAAVAVCVGADPGAMEKEMVERGVLPDLVFEASFGGVREMPNFGGRLREIRLTHPDAELALLQWQVAESPARWMGKLDAIALDCLQPDSWAHRWIRMYPRYCGRSAQARRALYCDLELARHIVDIFTAAVRNGAVGTEVMASLTIDDETKMSRLSSSRTA